MRRLFQSGWLSSAIVIAGFGLLVAYLIHTGDWRVSPGWALVYPLVAFSVARAIGAPRLSARFPALDRYIFYPAEDRKVEGPESNERWVTRNVAYLTSLFRGKGPFMTPGEDGLICVPVLLVGIHPLSAFLGGVAFGALHLVRFTYLQCIGKTVIYALVCYFVLPHGLLTVVLGHFLTNGISFAVLQVVKRKMERLQAVQRKLELRSKRRVDGDPRDTGAHRSP